MQRNTQKNLSRHVRMSSTDIICDVMGSLLPGGLPLVDAATLPYALMGLFYVFFPRHFSQLPGELSEKHMGSSLSHFLFITL